MCECPHVCMCVHSHFLDMQKPLYLDLPHTRHGCQRLQRDSEVFHQGIITPADVHHWQFTQHGCQRLICFQPGPSCPGVQKTPEQSRSWVGVGVEGTPRWNMGVAWKGQNSGPQLGEPAPALRPLREKQVCWSQGTSSPGVLPSSITHSVVSSSAS